MQKKLYNYLKAKGGRASSVAIVGQLLNIRGARRDVAERIVRGWVKDESLFISDGLGNWYINPEERQKGTPLNQAIFNLIEIRGDRKNLSRSAILEIGICQIRNGEILKSYTHTGVRNPTNFGDKIDLTVTAKPLKDILVIHLPLLEQGVLTSFNLPKVRNFISTEILKHFGEQLAFWELSLKDVSRRLYPKHKINSQLDLVRALRAPFFETEDMKIQLRNLSNLFFALVERVDHLGLKYLEELLEFQLPKRRRIDFENLKISRRFLAELPEAPGVYLFKNRKGEVVYVGKARNLKNRVSSYFYNREQQEEKLQRLWNELSDVKVLELGSELEALLEEQKLIRKYQPEINLQMEVHISSAKNLQQKNLIILLPSKKQEQFQLFCVNASGLSTKFSISKNKDISNKVSQKLYKLFFSTRNKTPKLEEKQQTEIILRWFERNNDNIYWIDINQVQDFEDCLRLINQYKEGVNFLMERVVYR